MIHLRLLTCVDLLLYILICVVQTCVEFVDGRWSRDVYATLSAVGVDCNVKR